MPSQIFTPKIACSALTVGPHGGFGCTIRYVPLRWLSIVFRALENLYYNRNSIRSYRNPTKIGRLFAQRSFVSMKRSQSLLGCGLPTSHVSSIKRVQYKKRRWNWGVIAVNSGTCQHFMSGGWDARVLSLYLSSSRQKKSKISFLAN